MDEGRGEELDRCGWDGEGFELGAADSLSWSDERMSDRLACRET